jgi:hypothetical protein
MQLLGSLCCIRKVLTDTCRTPLQATAAEDKLRQIQECNKEAVKENCRWAVSLLLPQPQKGWVGSDLLPDTYILPPVAAV